MPTYICNVESQKCTKCFLEGMVDLLYLNREGLVVPLRGTARPCGLGDTMTVYEAIMIALTFGILIVHVIGLIVNIVKNIKK